MVLPSQRLLVKDLGDLYISGFKLGWASKFKFVPKKQRWQTKSNVFSISPLILCIYITIRPKLEYSNTVWRESSVKRIKMIKMVQKRCSKFGILSDLSYEKRLSSYTWPDEMFDAFAVTLFKLSNVYVILTI